MCQPRYLGRKMLVCKHLPSQHCRLSKVGWRIVTEEVGCAIDVIRAELCCEERRAGKLRYPLPPYPSRTFRSLLRECHELFVTAQIIVILIERCRVFSPGSTIISLPHRAVLTSQSADNVAGHLILQRPGLGAGLVETVSPSVFTAFGVDKLRSDACLVALLPHAAFEHIADVEFLTDLPHIGCLALVGKGRCPGHYLQIREARQHSNNIFRYPVAQIAEAPGKRKHGN